MWVRENTPRDAYFALDSRYMAAPGQYNHPDVANEWRIQSDATRHLDSFSRKDFLKLRQEFGVAWVVTRASNERGEAHVTGLDCPYANNSVQVCRVN